MGKSHPKLWSYKKNLDGSKKSKVHRKRTHRQALRNLKKRRRLEALIRLNGVKLKKVKARIAELEKVVLQT